MQNIQTLKKHPVYKQNYLSLIPRRAELTTIPFDVSADFPLQITAPVMRYHNN